MRAPPVYQSPRLVGPISNAPLHACARALHISSAFFWLPRPSCLAQSNLNSLFSREKSEAVHCVACVCAVNQPTLLSNGSRLKACLPWHWI